MNTIINSFTNLIQQEISWLDELNTLLIKEKDVLSKSQFDELDLLSNQKQDLSDKLEHSATQRVQLLEEANQINPELSFKTLLNACNEHEAIQIHSLNKALSEKLALCRELNNINGQIISGSLYMKQELINTLSGVQNNATAVYNSEGSVTSNPGTNHHQEA